ncbi:hypothetical protein PF005_g12139 [Phytophthora fragariae]|uniref:BAR domain-containing protein n=1 Tax=Phytophthora fragariae TaxID=53985 RepID=A0A6A3K601_9STRA|nr:hypothetical protein PF009_g16975 [Phytophthora fragariae]KAE8999343.1 hypothetical protein PF011_g14668 [Phytophthora fragariae]KAE9099178.1 hypothetical protein PF007_g15976 [Phytophthora fragariae]KAE9099322.1 hypothetical protein PF010_g15240 [Phytophthora fragariae]KAE9143797.1 hypothetical protein PF006_g11199 [Phytophthora fragariae]
MSSSELRRRANRANNQADSEDFQEDGSDSCPVLGDDEMLSSNTRPQRIRDVRLIDNGVFTTKKTLAQRIRGRKNRLIQRVLVACHLAEPSRDVTFTQAQHSTKAAIDQLTAIRDGLFAHSQSIVNLSMAICSFTSNSARLHDDSLADVAAEGYKIRDCSIVFSDQVEKVILVQIDRRLAEFERVQSLIEERAKLVLDVDYAKRTLAVELQKGNADRIAERKHVLQSAQRDCERATRFITDHLKSVHPAQDDDMIALFQEYALLVAQFFKRGADFVRAEA